MSIEYSSDFSVVLSDQYPYDLYDQDKASSEKTLNLFGYIPAISTVSGPIRAVLGLFTVIASIIKVPLCMIADLFQKTPNGYFFRPVKHITYMGHGLLNMIRGCVELIPVLGNITAFVYDFAIGRISYPVESTGPHYILSKTPRIRVRL